jgi:hypothetical protein
MVDVTDLLQFASDHKPAEFETAFNNIMTDKITAAVNDKKIEIAKRMFNQQHDIADDTDEDSEEQ